MAYQMGGTTAEEYARIEVDGAVLDGRLRVPQNADSLVLFAEGGGRSRHGELVRHVARRLDQVRVATLYVDLVSRSESEDPRSRDSIGEDVEQLADRICGVRRWLARRASTSGLDTGYFGVDRAGGGTLLAAARESRRVGAVITIAGRPDLVADELTDLRAPTLLVARRGRRREVERNEEVIPDLEGEAHRMISIPETRARRHRGFPERVAVHSLAWVSEYLSPTRALALRAVGGEGAERPLLAPPYRNR